MGMIFLQPKVSCASHDYAARTDGEESDVPDSSADSRDPRYHPWGLL